MLLYSIHSENDEKDHFSVTDRFLWYDQTEYNRYGMITQRDTPVVNCLVMLLRGGRPCLFSPAPSGF